MSSDQPDTTVEAGADDLARFREEWRKEVEAKREVENKERQAALAAEKRQGKGASTKMPYGIGERARRALEKLEKSPERSKGKAIDTATSSFAGLSLSPPSSTSASYKAASRESATSVNASAGPSDPKKTTRAVAAAATREGIVASDAGPKAVEMYARAVEFEQSGQLNEALHLYRKAYKLDGSVEKAYRKKELEFEREAMSADTALTVTDPTLPIELNRAAEPYVFSDTKQFHPDYISPHAKPTSAEAEVSAKTGLAVAKPTMATDDSLLVPTDPLSILVNSWPSSDLIFTPEEEVYPIHISLLPDELFQPIFTFMDVQTLERFGSTCKKLRYLSRGAEKWKRLCERLYKPPILPEPEVEVETKQNEGEGASSRGQDRDGPSGTTSKDGSLPSTELSTPAESTPDDSTDLKADTTHLDILALETAALALARARRKQITDLARKHAFDWRTTFLEERRVRFDGVYISVCHYVRPGQSDLAWVNVTHLITYHRFLRFYPDGSVISLLTTDHPVDVVHTIKPSFRAKGLLFGTWGLTSMKTDKGLEQPKLEIRSLLEPGITPKYEFEMDLCLKCSTRGRWNKLEMLTYQSINLASGEALGLSLKHQKPFFFSKVRSYREAL